METLKYLKKGGRITPAAAAIGSVLNLKPVLQIQGEKLDAYSKVRGKKQAKRVMLKAMKEDLDTRFAEYVKKGEMCLQMAYTGNREEAEEFKEEVQEMFPGFENPHGSSFLKRCMSYWSWRSCSGMFQKSYSLNEKKKYEESQDMKKLMEIMAEELSFAFEKAGYNPEYGKVTVSNRPDLCEFQCNGAMAGAKAYKKAPFMIADDVVAHLKDSSVFSMAEVVKPGFINLKVKEEFLADYLKEMAEES